MTSLWHATASRRPAAVASLPDRAELVVVGAGLTGLTTALLAQRAGIDVLLLEARHLGAAATGNTTAKISLLQGTTLSSIRAHHDDDAVRAYVQANAAGQQQVHELMDELGVAYQREAAYTYVNDESSLSTLEKEYDAATAAGLPVLWAETTELPFRTGGAIRLADQLQMDPMELLEALRRAFVDAGGQVARGRAGHRARPALGHRRDDVRHGAGAARRAGDRGAHPRPGRRTSPAWWRSAPTPCRSACRRTAPRCRRACTSRPTPRAARCATRRTTGGGCCSSAATATRWAGSVTPSDASTSSWRGRSSTGRARS